MKSKIFNPAALFLAAIILLGTLGSLFTLPQVVTATAQLFYVTPTTLATTTSAFSYIIPGGTLATTSSPVLDANLAGPGRGLNSASLLLQLTASSSPNTALLYRYEYSQGLPNVDCKVTPLACDWYQESIDLSTLATSTITVRTYKEYSWVFASSSIGLSGVLANRANRLLTVPTPTRYARVIFYLAPGASQGALTSQWVAKAENF